MALTVINPSRWDEEMFANSLSPWQFFIWNSSRTYLPPREGATQNDVVLITRELLIARYNSGLDVIERHLLNVEGVRTQLFPNWGRRTFPRMEEFVRLGS